MPDDKDLTALGAKAVPSPAALDTRLAGSLDEEELKADLLYGIASHRPGAFK